MNGQMARASIAVKIGDIIEIKFDNKNCKYEVLEVKEIVRKEEGENMYRSAEA